MVYRGLVKDGVVVIETGVAFKEGTVVTIEAADPDADVAITVFNDNGLPECGRGEEIDRLIGGFRSVSKYGRTRRLDVAL